MHFLGTDISNVEYSPRKSVGGLRDMSFGGDSALVFLCAHQLATPKKRHIAHACIFDVDADPAPVVGSSNGPTSRTPPSGVTRTAMEGKEAHIDADGEHIFTLPFSHRSSPRASMLCASAVRVATPPLPSGTVFLKRRLIANRESCGTISGRAVEA